MCASLQDTPVSLPAEKVEPTPYGIFFSRIYDGVFFLFLYQIRKKISQETNKLQAKSVIDMCCGTGSQIKFLRKNKIPNLVGIDISDNMLAIARKKGLAKYCLKKDATNTNYANNIYDVALVSFALHETYPEVAQSIVNETVRIVKQGGIIIITDYVLDKNTLFIGKYGAFIIERMIGGKHYENYKFYTKKQLLKEYTVSLRKIREHSFLFGVVRVQIYNNIKTD